MALRVSMTCVRYERAIVHSDPYCLLLNKLTCTLMHTWLYRLRFLLFSIACVHCVAMRVFVCTKGGTKCCLTLK